jgi:hypothetical protein
LDRYARLAHALRRHGWVALMGLMVVLVVGSWWLTEPLADRGASAAAAGTSQAVSTSVEVNGGGGRFHRASVAWPRDRLEGMPAKSLLLDALVAADDRLKGIETYTATFHKQERIKGYLGPEQTLAMKVRNRPFALYFKFLGPQGGKEVVYAEGHHDNKVIAHAAGVARLLVPRLALPPDHPLALADCRHAVTEAGLANMTVRLIGFRRMDLNDAEASTVLDHYTDGQGNSWLRSVHTHAHHRPERPFARVEVLYDPITYFPIDIHCYDWPEPGHTGALLLAEHYSYENLNLDAELTALDFDPANPDYAFHRYGP